MSIPVLTFFNNKGGVGKTSLVYHLAWMFSELGLRILAVDLDPQANLTAAFLDEDQLVDIWENNQSAPNTIFRCVKPLSEVGDISTAETVQIRQNLFLIPGDIALSGFEDALSENWPKSQADDNLFRPFRILTAFWLVMQQAAKTTDANLILIDVGPNLGAINRSALIATDYVVIPLGADLFSLQGLRNLGPTLRAWRQAWAKRLDNPSAPTFPLPTGAMKPVGYIAQQHTVRLSRPVKAYDRWLNKIPHEYRVSVLGRRDERAPTIKEDPYCLAMLKHFRSLMPMAQEARKPLFMLKSADGAIGSHLYAVQDAFSDYESLAKKILGETIHKAATPAP